MTGGNYFVPHHGRACAGGGGVIISNMATAHKTETALKVSQAVTDTKLEALAAEARINELEDELEKLDLNAADEE